MNIIVRSILHYIQTKEKHKNSILAGGAVRDEILGLVPKDYDILVPVTSKVEVPKLITEIANEFGIKIDTIRSKGKEYEEMTQNHVRGVTEFVHEDLKFDIIGVFEPDDEDFPSQAVNQFDYGLNMVYDTGSYVSEDNENFKYDSDHGYFSLINLKSVQNLPNAIERFNKFNEKSKAANKGEWSFRAPCLRLTAEQKEDDYVKIKSLKKKYSGMWANNPFAEVAQAAPAPFPNELPPQPFNLGLAQTQPLNWVDAVDAAVVEVLPELDNNF
jgi:hypothetical protein